MVDDIKKRKMMYKKESGSAFGNGQDSKESDEHKASAIWQPSSDQAGK